MAPLLEPKRQLYLMVSPGAKLQVQSFPAYQQAHPELRVDHQLLAKWWSAQVVHLLIEIKTLYKRHQAQATLQARAQVVARWVQLPKDRTTFKL